MRIPLKLIVSVLVFISVVAACAPAPTAGAPSPTAAAVLPTQAPATPAPSRSGLWIAAAIPAALREAAVSAGMPAAESENTAAVFLDTVQPSAENGVTTWVYALVAPFPTVVDGVSEFELRSAWKGTPSETFNGKPLLVSQSTLSVFSALWGQPSGDAVEVLPEGELLGAAWADMPAWGIVPFEDLEPRWKVLTVDNNSPVRKDFDVSKYPLLAGFQAQGEGAAALTLPASNRDPEKMTTVIMTGVTALVRATAKTMEVKGILYPGKDIRDWMRQADIAHISNEIPFYSGCAYPKASQRALVFCSSPRYIDLLTDIGTDVIELTGNHFGDYGEVAMKQTLDIYNEKGIPYYGGGIDLADARKPLKLEDHGNKIAFVGCNPVDVGSFPTATDTRPGANPCDMEFQASQIRELKTEGYLVISTFQYWEYYSPEARPWQQDDFRLMADSGASIVSGSQAHFAQVMEFRNNDSFIHYGLGNLFFDQMGDIPPVPGIRRIFLDRHIIYNGKYISTELLTGMMEDHARPRPMTPEERQPFLHEYFVYSGWLPELPVPTPGPTLTLTPIVLPGTPQAAATPTPTP